MFKKGDHVQLNAEGIKQGWGWPRRFLPRVGVVTNQPRRADGSVQVLWEKLTAAHPVMPSLIEHVPAPVAP